MRKFLGILLALLLLAACKQSEEEVLKKIGYSEDEVSVIMKLSEENK